jgi:hemin uptake protein HemP
MRQRESPMNDDPVPDLPVPDRTGNSLEVRSLEVRPLEVRRPAPISSEALLDGQREIIIQHGTEQYRLRLTNNNKLILVK